MNLKLLLQLKPLIVKCMQFSPFKVLSALVLMLFSNVTSGIGILMIIPLLASVGIDIGISNAPQGFVDSIAKLAGFVGLSLDLQSVLLIYLILIIGVASLAFINSVVTTSLSQAFVVQLRRQLMREVFYAKWRYLSQEHLSDFIRLLTGQTQSVGSSLSLLLTLANSVIMVVVYLTFSLFVSPVVTLIALACALVLVLVLWPINKFIYASGGIGLRANRDIYRSIFDNVGSLKLIKSFSAEERYLTKLSGINAELEKQQIKMAKYNALTRWVNMVGAAIIFTLLFYTAIEWLVLPVGNLLVMLFIFSRLMPQISSIQSTLQRLIHQAPTYIDLLEQSKNLKQWTEDNDSKIAQAPSFTSTIDFQDVSYAYLGGTSDVLSSITTTINHNETVAIVGPSGVGKSTLADIIAGMVEPSAGQLLVDGVAIDEQNRLAWRQRVAYVTQDVFLFHESVRDNLSWVYQSELGQSVPEEELWHALSLAAADEFVKSMPQGLDTVIGDRGVKLSGGERQRLVLARALLSKPDVLILDEATSALDLQNELKIQDALKNLDGKLTIIVIAHNENTISHVNKRIELGNG